MEKRLQKKEEETRTAGGKRVLEMSSQTVIKVKSHSKPSSEPTHICRRRIQSQCSTQGLSRQGPTGFNRGQSVLPRQLCTLM